MNRSAMLLVLACLLAGCGETVDSDATAEQTEDTAEVVAPVTQPDLWLVDIETGEDGLPVAGEPRNLTDRPHYDNQPFFLDDSRIVYTAAREDGSTDPHVLDLATGESRPVLDTPETSEYSPTPVPGRGIVVVQVEEDGTTQRLWRFDPDAEAPGDRVELVLPDLEPVGYQGWLDEDRVVLYVLGSPATLHLAEVDTGFTQLVFEGIGASIQTIPGRTAVSFVEVGEDERWIRHYDGMTGETTRLIRVPDGSGPDHAWTPDGVLLMAAGSELLAARPEVDADWHSLGTLGPEGMEWSRIAVSPSGTRLVLVGTAR